jgi:hypothetical protein
VLSWLADGERSGQAHTCQTVALGVGIRRAEVRRALSSLHHAGLYDVLHGRVTLAGFAAGRALGGSRLAPIRSQRSDRSAFCAA